MTPESIDLTFINKSEDTNNTSVLLFQMNTAENFGELATAWKVIKNCGRNCWHPFRYDLGLQVSARDPYGNFSPLQNTRDGDGWDLVKQASGNELVLADNAANPHEIELRNALDQGAMDACVFRSGRLCAVKTDVAPQQKAVFQFRPRLYIAAVSQVDEGQTLGPDIVSAARTEINLYGINSADIVMTGGGAGEDAQPFAFQLENIK